MTLLLMALVAELVVVGPQVIRSLRRGEGIHVQAASVRALLVLVGVQIGLVLAWALLLRGRLV